MPAIFFSQDDENVPALPKYIRVQISEEGRTTVSRVASIPSKLSPRAQTNQTSRSDKSVQGKGNGSILVDQSLRAIGVKRSANEPLIDNEQQRSQHKNQPSESNVDGTDEPEKGENQENTIQCSPTAKNETHEVQTDLKQNSIGTKNKNESIGKRLKLGPPPESNHIDDFDKVASSPSYHQGQLKPIPSFSYRKWTSSSK